MTKRDIPISEKYQEKRTDMTREQCIDVLRRMAEDDPDRFITRNKFRVESGISESSWNRYFGTFKEFKAAAGVTVSRHVRRMEMAIAKHSSVDNCRAMSAEAKNWGGKYLRPSDVRYQTLLVAGDFHDKECDAFALRVFLDTARRVQPETIVLAGDLFDLPEFSSYAVDPREWGVVERIKTVHEMILAPLRELCPKAQIDLIGGNHEARLLRHLADATPAMLVLLADLHGMTISSLLGLTKYQVNYHHRGDLASWTKRHQQGELRRNFKVYHDCFLVDHETECGKRKGLPGVSAHNHKHQVWTFESPQFGVYEWHQLGCMHIRDASYTDGERWSVGFALAHIDTKARRVLTEYIPVGEDMAVVGGEYYFREPKEKLPLGLQKAPTGRQSPRRQTKALGINKRKKKANKTRECA